MLKGGVQQFDASLFEDKNVLEDEIISLNIGGKIFQTKKSTLTSTPSLFSQIFNSTIQTQKYLNNGYYFFDRDSKHFRYILNYLRTKKIIVPEANNDLHELLLEVEYYNIDELKYTIQRSLGGLLFEENFSNFNMSNGQWKECPPNYSCSRENNIYRYIGIPNQLEKVELNSSPALRMVSIVGAQERRSICTADSFTSITSRIEIKITPQNYEFTSSSDPSVHYGVLFEFYLWNPTTEEYIGLFLQYINDGDRRRDLYIVCHLSGTHKEKTVENVWESGQEVTMLIQSLQDKCEVRVNGTRRKTFHVPVGIERIAPFHIIVGQRGDNRNENCRCDIAINRIAVFG